LLSGYTECVLNKTSPQAILTGDDMSSTQDDSMKKTMTYLTVGLFALFFSIIALANAIA